jgi:16S rRNA (guanine966-N2)-methyltransferase
MSRTEFTTRIMTGSLRYRVLKQPGEGTRPISQKVRQAIFSSLGNDMAGLMVLDLYAGSGALGIEALSLGARTVEAVESGRPALHALKSNATELELGDAYRICADRVEMFLKRTTSAYNVIFFDPPYADFSVETATLAADRLQPAGVLVISCSSREKLPDILGTASQAKTRTYGDTQIAYYKK